VAGVTARAAAVVGGWVAVALVLSSVVSTCSAQLDNKSAALPNTRGMGLEYARKVVLKQNKFENVSAHDSTGRGRSVRNGHDWKVCEVYQKDTKGGYAVVKDPTTLKRGITIDLGVVQVDEKCGPDLRLANPGDLAYPMPRYRGYTPAEISRAMRPEATLRFYSAIDGSSISSREYGRWRVCSQQLAEGATFYGQPVAFTAVPFDKDSNANPPVPTNLDATCPDNGWQGVRGYPPDRFPALVSPS
jgi:hypothetical protein